MLLELASFASRNEQAKGLHETADLIGELGRNLNQPVPRRGARRRITSAMSLGSEPHLPRQIRLPSRRIDTAVSFIDTSRPTYSAIFILRSPAPKPARSRDGLAAPS